MPKDILLDEDALAAILYTKLKALNPGIADLEPYEFRYGLNNLTPDDGWAAVELDRMEVIEERMNDRAYYNSIQIKHKVDDRIVLDEKIVQLSRMLLVGLGTGEYPIEWVRQQFYFDIRGFYFLHRTVYFTNAVLAHFDQRPFMQFEPKQKHLERMQDVGYKAFKQANAEVDRAFIDCVKKLIEMHGTPIVLAIAGPTAAGKTEIVDRLRAELAGAGKSVTSIELDNFLTDRDEREAKGIHSQGKEALHFELLQRGLQDICAGKKISIPRYDFVYATSSHNLDGTLKPGGVPIEIEPADIIFIEGNFPFLIEEVVHLIGIKVVYLTDDPVRLKRKWKRDIDYRKKYEPNYFRNRYFKDQFIMAEIAYRPQLERCDICVDTTGAKLWVTPAVRSTLEIHK